MLKLEVGQKVWIKRVGLFATNLDRRNAPLEDYIFEDEVVHVGKKLFRVKDCHFHKEFDLETGRNYQKAHRYTAYTTKQEIYDEESIKNLASQLSLIINKELLESLTLKALQTIDACLQEKKT